MEEELKQQDTKKQSCGVHSFQFTNVRQVSKEQKLI